MKPQVQTKKPQQQPQQPQGVQWDSYEATGMEQVSQEDLGIPFLIIVQKGSPEFDKTHPAYETRRIPGCEPGSIIHTTKKTVIGGEEPAIFIPCAYEKLWVEWKARNTGGGFIRHHTSPLILTECKRNEKNQDVLENGNIIVPTAYFYGYVSSDSLDENEKVIIPMTSTQLRVARQWLNLATSFKMSRGDGSKFVPPLFSHAYYISTVPESNEKGSWFGWKIEDAGVQEDRDLISACADVAKGIRDGTTRRLIGAPPVDAESTPY